MIADQPNRPMIISIHTPLAGSDPLTSGISMVAKNFNPHSPCGERLADPNLIYPGQVLFQSTLPLRGATFDGVGSTLQTKEKISIHTPLAGSDDTWCWTTFADYNFNPHSPCGERPQK